MRTSLLFVSAALVGALAAGAPAADPPGTDEWIAELDKAFAARSEPLKPPLVIFPMLDAGDRVAADGAGFSNMAAFAAVCTNRKHIDFPVRAVRDLLREAGCTKAKTILDKETIQLVLKACTAKLYAVPKLVERDGSSVLTIACHGDGGAYSDKTFTHTIQPGERRRIPGLIARSVHEFLGVQLTPEERERVAAPQLQNEQDLRTLLDIDADRIAWSDKPSLLHDLLQRNPRCVLGWEIAITTHATRREALRRFQELRPPLECPRLHVAVAVQVRDLGEPDRALRMLLPYAASHRSDTGFYVTMTKCGMALKDERLTRHILELWRKGDPSYLGCLDRGELLVQWAWEARGGGWANTVTPEGARQFQRRLLEAHRELNEALRINPDGWAAHAHLINVAKGLGLPRPFVEEHFQRAVKLRPRYLYAYQTKMEYLRPRWHGTPEEMLDFGRQCAETAFWDEWVPRLFRYSLLDCCTNPLDQGRDIELLRIPEVWRGALAYYRSAETSAGPDDRRWARNQFIEWGIQGEHYDDIVVACQKLRGPDRIEAAIFPDRTEVEFFYDLVHAKTGKLMTQLYSPRKNDLALARTGAALAAGDVEEAAKWIEQIEAGEHLPLFKVASYRAAIALGRKLLRDKQVDLTGAEGLGAFVGARPLWKYSGDVFVCQLPANSRAILTFPLGIPHGTISGTIDGADNLANIQVIAHTRAARDQVIVRYDGPMTVSLVRNNVRLVQAVHPPGAVSFRLVYHGDSDVIEPTAGITWNARVYNDVPSGFSLRFYAADRPATVTLRGLRIEQPLRAARAAVADWPDGRVHRAARQGQPPEPPVGAMPVKREAPHNIRPLPRSDGAHQLGALAMRFRRTRDEAVRRAIAADYAREVQRLIEIGDWSEAPAFEDQLPVEWMPEAFFRYWSPDAAPRPAAKKSLLDQQHRARREDADLEGQAAPAGRGVVRLELRRGQDDEVGRHGPGVTQNLGGADAEQDLLAAGDAAFLERRQMLFQVLVGVRPRWRGCASPIGWRGDDISDARPELHELHRQELQAVAEWTGADVMVLDTTEPVAVLLPRILDRLRRLVPRT